MNPKGIKGSKKKPTWTKINARFERKKGLEWLDSPRLIDGPFCAKVPDGWIGDDLRLEPRKQDCARFPTMDGLLDASCIMRHEGQIGIQEFKVYRDDGYPLNRNGRMVEIGHVVS